MTVELLAFAGVMALGQFSPGPDMVLLTRTSLAAGAGQGVRMAMGIATGLSLHAAIAVGGAAVVFEQSAAPKLVMSIGAAVYLIWLAIQLIRAGRRSLKHASGQEDSKQVMSTCAYRRGLLCNLLNPKVALFLAAVAAPFLQGERPSWWVGALWGIIVFEGLLLWVAWAWLLQWQPVKLGYRRAAPWLDMGFGVVLAALAVALVVGHLG